MFQQSSHFFTFKKFCTGFFGSFVYLSRALPIPDPRTNSWCGDPPNYFPILVWGFYPPTKFPQIAFGAGIFGAWIFGEGRNEEEETAEAVLGRHRGHRGPPQCPTSRTVAQQRILSYHPSPIVSQRPTLLHGHPHRHSQPSQMVWNSFSHSLVPWTRVCTQP